MASFPRALVLQLPDKWIDNAFVRGLTLSSQSTRRMKSKPMRRILRLIPDSIYKIFLRPSFRYSSHYFVMQKLFSYTARELILKTALEFTLYSKLEGDYLEFGVFEGDNFAAAFHLAQSYSLCSMNFYAFDSFQGLPPITGVDADGFRSFEAGEFPADINKFKDNIRRKAVDINKVKIIPGWYSKVLNDAAKKSLPLTKAAVIYIDCDLYESTVPVLDFITAYLQDGTIIIFDDWFSFRGNPDRGEQKAFREWLDRNPTIKASEFYKFGWQSTSFVIHRNGA